jgi:dTMP kinase
MIFRISKSIHMSKLISKSKSNKPKFIVIEGGEGSGKSTLMISLKEALGDAIVTTREPGGSPYAEVIREATLKNPLAKTAPAETTLCLMFAARFDNTQNAIVPALKSGTTVIADRFDGSSYAYNVMAQSGGALENIFWDLRKRLTVVPDLYIFVDVEPEEGTRRANRRNQSLLKGKQYDHFDDREIVFHKKVRDGYLKFLTKVPHVVIDANRPFEEVKKDFIAEIKKVLSIA